MSLLRAINLGLELVLCCEQSVFNAHEKKRRPFQFRWFVLVSLILLHDDDENDSIGCEKLTTSDVSYTLDIQLPGFFLRTELKNIS